LSFFLLIKLPDADQGSPGFLHHGSPKEPKKNGGIGQTGPAMTGDRPDFIKCFNNISIPWLECCKSNIAG